MQAGYELAFFGGPLADQVRQANGYLARIDIVVPLDLSPAELWLPDHAEPTAEIQTFRYVCHGLLRDNVLAYYPAKMQQVPELPRPEPDSGV